MEDDFALRFARIYPGVNSRAELVTLAPGLRPERRFAPLARGLHDGEIPTSSRMTSPLAQLRCCKTTTNFPNDVNISYNYMVVKTKYLNIEILI